MPLHDHSNDTYFRFPVQPNGLEEDKEDPAGPAVPGLEEADSSDQNSSTSHQTDAQTDAVWKIWEEKTNIITLSFIIQLCLFCFLN